MAQCHWNMYQQFFTVLLNLQRQGIIKKIPIFFYFCVLRNYSKYPMNFEKLDQSSGFVIYETDINDLVTNPVELSVPGLRDRGTVFVDHKPAGVLSRFNIS